MGGPYDFGNDRACDPEGKGRYASSERFLRQLTDYIREWQRPEQTAAASISTPTSARPLLLLDTETTASNPCNPRQRSSSAYANVCCIGQPGREQWLVMVSLSVVSFMVSLDATILVAVLPVRSLSVLDRKRG
jgi:hypothetical protein